MIRAILPEPRKVAFITQIPKPKKQKGIQQEKILFDAAAQALGTEAQQYDLSAFIGGVRQRVDRWRELPDPNAWGVTPETARLLTHWCSHRFGDIRPFFCQVEAVETAIWLTEVAPTLGLQRVIDLSATPFFLRGSGYAEGTLFPLDGERLLADGRHRVRHREAAARAGGRQHPRWRDAEVPEPVGAHPPEDAEAGRGKAGGLSTTTRRWELNRLLIHAHDRILLRPPARHPPDGLMADRLDAQAPVAPDRPLIKRRLKQDGWVLLRHGTNHDVYRHPRIKGIITLPRHRTVTPGVARSIAGKAGWPE